LLLLIGHVLDTRSQAQLVPLALRDKLLQVLDELSLLLLVTPDFFGKRCVLEPKRGNLGVVRLALLLKHPDLFRSRRHRVRFLKPT
jgi:hypothetical protein